MSEWRDFSVEELGELLNSRRIPVSSTERSSRKGNYPYYGASGIVDYVNDFIFEGEHVLISEDGENLRTRKTPIAFLADGRFWVNNHAHIVKCHSKYLSRLMVYYFATLDLNQYITGAVQPKLSKSSLCSIPISLPESPDEQRAISEVLSSLDDKINLLHRQNETLEAMAETLFRQWFVETASEQVPITHYVEFNPSRKLAKGTLAPYLDMAGISTSTFCPSSWFDREFSSGTKFINGDTLLARITPCLENGKSAFVTFLGAGQVGWGSTEFIVMRSRDNLSLFFTYALARNEEFGDYAEGCMAGSSGRQRVDVEHLKQFEIGRLSDNAISEFNRSADSIPPKLHMNMLQIRTLEKLRDTLLPKLMSGEVRVQYE